MNVEKTIRLAELSDIQRITDIYNKCIRIPFCTADTQLQSKEQKTDWFHSHNPDTHPIFVFEDNTTICGYAYISPYRNGRQALSSTVELSYYLHPDFFRQGIGSRLVHHCIEFCKMRAYKNIIAIVLSENNASIALLSKFGFEKWGHLPLVAEFENIECGHIYLGKRI